MVFSLKLLNWMCQHAESVSVFLISGFDEMQLEYFTFISSTTLFVQWNQATGILHELCHEGQDLKIHCLVSAVN